MTNQTKVNVLSDVVAVNLHFSIWTGRKKLADNDLSLNGEVPPKELVNLGSKHTTDPKALKVFSTLKRQAERLCLSVGIPFLGGYAIPEAKADSVANKLAKIVAQFELEKEAYLVKHEAIQDEWISKYPAYANVLVQALTPVHDVQSRISAEFSMYKVQSAQAAVQSTSTGLDKQADKLSSTLDEDILKSANKLLESLSSAITPNRVNVSGLVGLREKVEGLAFLNGKFAKLVTEIKKIEAQMPVAGKLSTDETNILSGMLYRLSDPIRLQALMSNLDTTQTETAIPAIEGEVVELDDADFDFADAVEFDADFDFGDTEIEEATISIPDANPATNAVFF